MKTIPQGGGESACSSTETVEGGFEHEDSYELQTLSFDERSRKVGEGSFGRVVTARTRGDKLVVVKTVRGPDTREIEMITTVNGHPCIVVVFATHSDARCYHIIMKAASYDLARMLRTLSRANMRLKEDLCRLIILHLVRALLYIRAKGIIHRDIKPANVLVDGAETRLADFGSAKREDQKPHQRGMGTLPYRAPEIHLMWQHYGYAADMFSLGCLAAELCMGEPLFVGDSPPEVIACAVRTLGSPSESQWKDLDVTAPCFPYREPALSRRLVVGGRRVSYGPSYETLLYRMLEWSPATRACPTSILHSAFLRSSTPRFLWTTDEEDVLRASGAKPHELLKTLCKD